MTEKLTNIKEEILKKIRTHEVSMRPKAYFTLKLAALVLVALAVLLLTVFLANFIFFIVRFNHHELLLGRGVPELWVFLRLFPWEFLLLDGALLLVVERLLREFSFGYRTPVLLSLLVILALVISAGLLIDRETGANDELLRRADRHGLPPPFGELYEHARRPLPPEFEPPEIKPAPAL